MFLEKSESGSQAAAVYELHHRKKFFELVFQRRAGEHQGVAALELLDGARRGRRPIADTLGFVEDDQVGAQIVHVLDIFQDEFVVGEIEERGLGIELLPMRQQPVNHLG